MDSKKLVIVIVAVMTLPILIGAVAGMLFWTSAEKQDPAHEALVADQVRVAKITRDLAEGDRLSEEHYELEAMPERFLPPDAIRETQLNGYLGRPVTQRVVQGQLLHRTDFSP